MITSSSNSQIKRLQLLLKKRKEREEQGVFVVEGIKIFKEALTLDRVEKAYFAEFYFNSLSEEEKNCFSSIEYETVSDSVFNSIAETVTPQGVIAIVKMVKPDIDRILRNAKRLVLLENLQDPGNLGTIIRTSEAAGVEMCTLSEGSVDIYNPKTVRSTMGAMFRVPVAYVPDMVAFVKELNEKGFNTIATDLSATNDYSDDIYGEKAAVIIGNEGNGLTKETVEAANTRVIIPMEGNVESLNAGVAAALMMYEMKRRISK